MKAVTKPYKLFGRQCKNCGAYFVYDFADAIASPYCPCCYSKFDHSVDDPAVDVDPDIPYLKSQRTLRGEAEDSVIIPEFSVHQSVYAIARKNASASWYYYGITTIEKIIYVAGEGASKLYYIVSDKIEGTNSTATDKIRLFASPFAVKLSRLLSEEELQNLPEEHEKEDDSDEDL